MTRQIKTPTRQVLVRLPLRLLEELDRIAEERGLDRTSLMKVLLDEALRRIRKQEGPKPPLPGGGSL